MKPEIRPGLGLALTLAIGLCLACDKGKDEAKDKQTAAEDDKPDAPAEAPKTEAAKAAEASVAELKAELDKGEDIKYPCVGYVTQHRALKSSKEASEQQAWAALSDMCHVQLPRQKLEALRAALDAQKAGKELAPGQDRPSSIATDLDLIISDAAFPKEGEPAKIAAEARRLIDVDMAITEIEGLLADGEKACAMAQITVDEKREALAADEKGKAVLERYDELCSK